MAYSIRPISNPASTIEVEQDTPVLISGPHTVNPVTPGLHAPICVRHGGSTAEQPTTPGTYAGPRCTLREGEYIKVFANSRGGVLSCDFYFESPLLHAALRKMLEKFWVNAPFSLEDIVRSDTDVPPRMFCMHVKGDSSECTYNNYIWLKDSLVNIIKVMERKQAADNADNAYDAYKCAVALDAIIITMPIGSVCKGCLRRTSLLLRQHFSTIVEEWKHEAKKAIIKESEEPMRSPSFDASCLVEDLMYVMNSEEVE